jgi:hypothetical protein
MKKATISLTIAIVLTALIIFDSHQAQAAPAAKKIRVTDGGEGTFACSSSRLTDDGATSGAGAAGTVQIGVTADKITGKVSGTWQIIFPTGSDVIASGDITGGKIKADSFRLSGVEKFLFFDEGVCGPTGIPVTFTGQCGNDVAISFKAERQQPDLSQTQTAIFRDVSVSCTK